MSAGLNLPSSNIGVLNNILLIKRLAGSSASVEYHRGDTEQAIQTDNPDFFKYAGATMFYKITILCTGNALGQNFYICRMVMPCTRPGWPGKIKTFMFHVEHYQIQIWI